MLASTIHVPYLISPIPSSHSISSFFPLSLFSLSIHQGADWFQAKVDIEVSQASRAAIKAVERVGGKIVTVHFNKLGLRQHLKPHKFADRPKPQPALPGKKLMPYYLNPKNR